ncbi:M15 family metallopeptidase [Nocardioides sp. CER19]|uniref:M15 family metallopeptidase n=1 Tax=Nocardioides sp. CER19 TaxID=3038538 RepID=UPI00244C1B96|nr:M15 family metallopeptidase [Nocardioides sp. CER19]MDH2413983.1 M15 family metallopeptidase [Nocardioides sp. CER19]
MRRVVVGLIAVVLGMSSAPAWSADPAAPAVSVLTATAPPPTYAGQPASIGFTLTTGDPATPLAGQPVTVERQRAGAWQPVGTVTTDAAGAGRATVAASRTPADNTVRLSFAGDETHAAAQVLVVIPLRRRTSRVTVTGPGRVVDEQSTRVRVAWRADSGEAVSGRVTLQVAERQVVTRKGKRVVQWRWRTAAVLLTDAQGVATYTSTPRADTRWRAIAPTLPWVTGASSGVYALDNRPPGPPVRLPGRAPTPKRRLPVQPHAVGAGPHAVVTSVPDDVWRSMVGRTWHSGCPVGRTALRLIRVNYWDYTGYRRRGEIVVAASVAAQVAAAFSDLYSHRLPLRSMVREDRFGWSGRLHGADDYKSMQAGNTSGFNCRGVVGNPRTLSPHSYGTAIDLNTWENPYRSRQGTVPNRWWQRHSHPRVAWRSSAHVVVRIMASHGLHWTYGLGDTQHFDAVPPGASRPIVVACGLRVCE